MSDSAKLGVTYVFAALGGFIPIRESYRLNYSTKVIGLPMEISGGFMFPVTTEIMVPITARYVRREANFIASTTIGVVSIEPGVRFYLEKERPKDLRIFGAIEGIIAEASVNSIYDVSPNGDVLSQGSASKDYLNIGIGFDLGVVYPLGSSGALDGSVHTSYFPSNTIAHGGLGNIGGVSLTVGYRIGF